MKNALWLSIACLLSAGCQMLAAYDGAHRSDADLARITGDLRVTAGLPVSIILRQVDERNLALWQRGVKVLPGAHNLLIDCTVTESKQTSRHHLHVDVDAGGRYRLVAATGKGNRECTDVQLVSY